MRAYCVNCNAFHSKPVCVCVCNLKIVVLCGGKYESGSAIIRDQELVIHIHTIHFLSSLLKNASLKRANCLDTLLKAQRLAVACSNRMNWLKNSVIRCLFLTRMMKCTVYLIFRFQCATFFSFNFVCTYNKYTERNEEKSYLKSNT